MADVLDNYIFQVLQKVGNSFTLTVCKGGFVEVILGPAWKGIPSATVTRVGSGGRGQYCPSNTFAAGRYGIAHC